MTSRNKKSLVMHRSHHTTIGKRDYQEDRICIESPLDMDSRLHFFCVLDGHGGCQAADMCKQNAILCFKQELVAQKRKTGKYDIQTALNTMVHTLVCKWDDHSLGPNKRVEIVDEQSRLLFFETIDSKHFAEGGLDSGTTICAVVYCETTNTLFIANLGDSRCVIDHENSVFETKDHSVPDKIPADMSIIPYNFTYTKGRVEDDLAMCRSVGDNTPRLLGVIGRVPDICKKKLKKTQCKIILATDGLFDVSTAQKLFLDGYDSAKEYMTALGGDDGFDDNTSMIYITLNWV